MNTRRKRRTCWCDRWDCCKCKHYNYRILYSPKHGNGMLNDSVAHLRAVRIPALMARADCGLPLFDGRRKDTDE